MADWFYQHNGRSIGPITEALMREWVQQKAVLPTHWVRRADASEWQRAGSCSEFFPGGATADADTLPVSADDQAPPAVAIAIDRTKVHFGVACAAVVFGLILRCSSHAIAWPSHYSYSGPREGTEWAVREAAINDIGMACIYLGGIFLIGKALLDERKA